jgi:multidrug efflux pump subunit AcrB
MFYHVAAKTIKHFRGEILKPAFFDMPFGFMVLLGFLSLSGMLIKNEIVLLDQINI